jgi:hypothetical protein
MQKFKTIAEGLEKYLGEQMPLAPEEFNFKNNGEIVAYFKKIYPNVYPTVQDYTIAIADAFEAAKRRMEVEEKKYREMALIEKSKEMWTFDEMKKQALFIGSELGKKQNFTFKLGKNEEKIFDLLCLYFTNDPQFESNGFFVDGQIQQPYSLKKGIWLQSGVRGVGKSVMLQCFKFNKRQCFNYCHTTELRANYQQDGYSGIDFFMKTRDCYPGNINFYQKEIGWMYDEMFNEQKANYMGTPEVISEYIVNSLYDFSKNYKGEFWKFHCTSNADGNYIEEKYGVNYRSRMREMFNFIKLEGDSKR